MQRTAEETATMNTRWLLAIAAVACVVGVLGLQHLGVFPDGTGTARKEVSMSATKKKPKRIAVKPPKTDAVVRITHDAIVNGQVHTVRSESFIRRLRLPSGLVRGDAVAFRDADDDSRYLSLTVSGRAYDVKDDNMFLMFVHDVRNAETFDRVRGQLCACGFAPYVDPLTLDGVEVPPDGVAK